MINNKIIISRINAVSALRNRTPGLTKTEGGRVNAADIPYCSYEHDNLTTYVRKKEWVIELNAFIFPPYVECFYVE